MSSGRDTTDPRDREIANLRAELHQAYDFVEKAMARLRRETAAMTHKVEVAEKQHAMQKKNTSAFREDWLREKERADGLEAERANS